MTTVWSRALVSKGKVENVLKKDKWVWRPKMNYQDHVYKYNGSYMLKKFEYVDPKEISKYGYIKNHKKIVKNGQTQTRETEEHKRSQGFKRSQEKSTLTLEGELTMDELPWTITGLSLDKPEL
ncbi:hypothetical protein Tco_0934881 [Tanacetum coccineum]